MRRLVVLLALGLAAAAPSATPAVAGPHEWHYCPAEARGTVSHDGDGGWVATSQSSRLVDMRIAPIGGITAMVCVYRMFGSDYWIYKHPSPAMPVCQPSSDGSRRAFFCRPV